MSSIPDDLAQRMAALIRTIGERYHKGDAAVYAVGSDAYAWMREASAMLPDLPVPVDRDIVEAREFLILSHGAGVSEDYRRYARNGSYDDNEDCRRWLAAIKRGRELASKDTPDHG